MTKEEYLKKLAEDSDWAPGWDAIDAVFDELYPGQEPSHYATKIESRAMFGGNEYLDGFSYYKNDKGYLHVVTYGMSELYGDENVYGKEYSRWGYEMTMKLKDDFPYNPVWVANMMSNLARYTYTTERFFEAEQYVGGNGEPICTGSDSKISGLILVNDTTAKTQDTVHGRLEFIQLVGITTDEVNAIKEDLGNLKKILEAMKKDNPELITDMKRDFNYV